MNSEYRQGGFVECSEEDDPKGFVMRYESYMVEEIGYQNGLGKLKEYLASGKKLSDILKVKL